MFKDFDILNSILITTLIVYVKRMPSKSKYKLQKREHPEDVQELMSKKVSAIINKTNMQQVWY
jgi:hypothetical protein